MFSIYSALTFITLLFIIPAISILTLSASIALPLAMLSAFTSLFIPYVVESIVDHLAK